MNAGCLWLCQCFCLGTGRASGTRRGTHRSTARRTQKTGFDSIASLLARVSGEDPLEDNYSREDVKRERNNLKAGYRDAYSRLEALLFEEDPVGINFGFNQDEYGPEVGTILPTLGSCRNLEEIQQAVHLQFCRWFGADTAGPIARYARIAQRILAELPELLAGAG